MCPQELKRDMDDHSANKEYINRTGHELIARYPTDMAGVLEADLSSLNTRWQAVSTAIEQRQARLEKAISQMKEYQVTITIYFIHPSGKLSCRSITQRRTSLNNSKS